MEQQIKSLQDEIDRLSKEIDEEEINRIDEPEMVHIGRGEVI